MSIMIIIVERAAVTPIGFQNLVSINSSSAHLVSFMIMNISITIEFYFIYNRIVNSFMDRMYVTPKKHLAKSSTECYRLSDLE